MLCVGIGTEPDGVRGLACSNGTREAEHSDAAIMLGEEGLFACFYRVL